MITKLVISRRLRISARNVIGTCGAVDTEYIALIVNLDSNNSLLISPAASDLLYLLLYSEIISRYSSFGKRVLILRRRIMPESCWFVLDLFKGAHKGTPHIIKVEGLINARNSISYCLINQKNRSYETT